MVSSVLAQAILNQQVPDIIGEFERGRESARQNSIRTLSGAALQGDQNALAQLIDVDPQAGLQLQNVLNLRRLSELQLQEQLRIQSKQGLNDFIGAARITKKMLEGGNVQGAINFGEQRLKELQARGADPAETQSILNLMRTDPARALQEVNAFTSSIEDLEGKSSETTKIREYQYFSNILKDPNASEEEKESARYWMGLQGRSDKTIDQIEAEEAAKGRGKIATERELAEVKIQTEEDLTPIKRRQKLATELGADEAGRLSKYIEAGLDASTRMPDIERGLELLETVETGGLTALSKNVTDFFGTTSGDVAELNNILAQQVLAGLANFSGAISDSERRFLEKMETNLSGGTEFNVAQLKRMKQIMEKQVVKARRAAKETGDEFSLELLNENLERRGEGLMRPQQNLPPYDGDIIEVDY